MKRLSLTFFLICLTVVSYAQEPLAFARVVQVDGVSQRELYGRAQAWFADAFKNSAGLLQTAETQVGQIVTKPVYVYSPQETLWGNVGGAVRYTVRVFCKNGKYSYEITDFSHELYGLLTTDDECPYKGVAMMKRTRNKIWADMKEMSHKEAAMLVQSLEKRMNPGHETSF